MFPLFIIFCFFHRQTDIALSLVVVCPMSSALMDPMPMLGVVIGVHSSNMPMLHQYLFTYPIFYCSPLFTVPFNIWSPLALNLQILYVRLYILYKRLVCSSLYGNNGWGIYFECLIHELSLWNIWKINNPVRASKFHYNEKTPTPSLEEPAQSFALLFIAEVIPGIRKTINFLSWTYRKFTYLVGLLCIWNQYIYILRNRFYIYEYIYLYHVYLKEMLVWECGMD